MTVPGGKIAAAPASRSSSTSCGGITPPTTTRMSPRPSSVERRLELGDQRQVAGRQRRHADDVHVGLDGLAGDLGRRLEQRADVDVEAEVGERRGDDLLAAVVAVLADLGDEDPRLAAVIEGELLDERPHLGDVGRVPDLLAVHPANRTDRRRVAAEHRLHRRGDLADRGVRPGGGDRQGEQVGVGIAGRAVGDEAGGGGQAGEGVVAGRLIALGPQPIELGDLLGAHRRVVDLEHLDVVGDVGAEDVDADDGLAAGVDARLRPRRGLLDAQLGDAGLDRLGHPAGGLDLGDVRPRAGGEVVGQPLDVVAAAPRIDHPARSGLVLEDELGVAGDARREVGRQGERFVEGVGVQRLGVPLRRRHRLDARAHDVVEHVLGGERPARRLAVRAQRQRLGAARGELPDELGPQQPGGAQLGDLHEEVHADGEEERQPRRERVDVETRR